jgi:hypothetical protein
MDMVVKLPWRALKMSGYPQEQANEIMAGMEQVYRNEEERLKAMAPRCHFRPMFLDSDYYTEYWWKCSVCGHTKAHESTCAGVTSSAGKRVISGGNRALLVTEKKALS